MNLDMVCFLWTEGNNLFECVSKHWRCMRSLFPLLKERIRREGNIISECRRKDTLEEHGRHGKAKLKIQSKERRSGTWRSWCTWPLTEYADWWDLIRRLSADRSTGLETYMHHGKWWAGEQVTFDTHQFTPTSSRIHAVRSCLLRIDLLSLCDDS